jgi:hypothetical protein
MKKHKSSTIQFVLTFVLVLLLALVGTTGAQYPEPIPSIPEDQEGEITAQGAGDNPLTTSFSFTGRVGLSISVIPFSGVPSPGTFNISGIPVTATIKKALMYVQRWNPPLTNASATLAGNTLGPLPAFSSDLLNGFNLQAYRFDVATIVNGNGSYPFTFNTGGGQNYYAALIVVFSDASLPSRRIHINDGSEGIGSYNNPTSTTSTTTYSDLVEGPGTLTIVTQADDFTGIVESLDFNGATILGPGNIFNSNLGSAASLFQLPVSIMAGTNTASISTDGVDVFGWHLAILESPELPPEGDIDNDGLLNGWEINGFDENGDGTIDLDLPALGANPMHKDLFVEVDTMVGRAPTQAALNRVVAAFATVPNSLVDNPDGMDGITLHIQLDETNIPLADWPNAFVDFDNVKNNRFGTPAQRADTNWSNIRDAKGRVYRYCIFANTHSGTSSSGLAEMPGDDFMVTLGAWPTPGGTEDQQVGTFMHEFGHNLNLGHGGDDSINFKPNYHSIMNYHWQMPHSNHTGWGLDYSREVLPTLNELNLDESAGIGGAAGVTVPVGPLPVEVVNENGPVDWNRDGDTWDTSIQADINYVRSLGPGGPSPGQVLTGYNDWPVLWYRLSGHLNFQDGVHDETTIPEEITYEMYREVYEARVDFGFDFEPDTLNLQSQGQFVTVYIELPEGSAVSQIDVSSLTLNTSVPASSTPVEIGDYDGDGITDLMVKFARQQVAEVLEVGEQEVCLTGRLSDGTALAGIDTIRVLDYRGGEEAIAAEEAAGFTLFEASERIDELDPENFTNEDSATELTNEIDFVLSLIYDEGLLTEALYILENDILERTNGCADIGEPDDNDWITTYEGQGEVYPLIVEAIELLESLIQ